MESRRNILQAAEKLFAENGFDGTATKQIAAEASVPAGLVFYYFSNKTELLVAVLRQHTLAVVANEIFGDLDPQAGLAVGLQRAAAQFLVWLQVNRYWARLFFQELTSGREHASVLRQERQDALRVVSEWVRKANGRGTQVDAEMIAHLFASSVLTAALVDMPDNPKAFARRLGLALAAADARKVAPARQGG